jgi:hypothetical protein
MKLGGHSGQEWPPNVFRDAIDQRDGLRYFSNSATEAGMLLVLIVVA